MNAILQMPGSSDKQPARRGTRGGGSVFRPTYKVAGGERRESKTWWIRYFVDGKRIHENSGSEKKTVALKMLTDRLGKLHKGEFEAFESYKDVTLGQLFDMLRSRYHVNGCRSGVKLEINLRKLTEHFGADCRVINLTTEKVEEYFAARMASEPKPGIATVRNELVNLKTALRLGLKADKVRRVPHINLPDVDDRAKDGEFSPDQFWAVHAKVEPWLQPVVEFAYRTGWRVQEILGLTWSEVRFDLAVIKLPGRRAKNGKDRPVGLSGKVLGLLERQRQVVPAGVEFVFPDADGTSRITYDRAVDRFQTACAGLPANQFTTADGDPRRPGFHDLRRTFARVALRSGMNESDVMLIAGWKTPIMLRRYLGNNEEGQRQALSAADRAFG